MLAVFWLPGGASTFDPMAAEAWPSSSTQSWVRKGLAGRRGVGQHIVQKEARKTSKDVHGAEEDTERIIYRITRGDRNLCRQLWKEAA